MDQEELQALENAQQLGYLLVTSGSNQRARELFRTWCIAQGVPFALVEQAETSAALTLDTQTVWHYYVKHHGLPEELFPFFTLDPTDELREEVHHIIDGSGFTGGAGYGGSYTWIQGLPIEKSMQTMQALLAVWEKALAFHQQRFRASFPASKTSTSNT